MSDSLRLQTGLHHTRILCPSLSLKVWSNSHPLTWWCCLTVSSSVIPFPPALNLSQHQGLFQWVRSSNWVAKVLELQLQHQSFQQIFSTDFLSWLPWSPCSPGDSQKSSPIPQFESISSSVLRFLYGSTLTAIHGHWKKHKLDYMDLCWQSNVSAF